MIWAGNQYFKDNIINNVKLLRTRRDIHIYWNKSFTYIRIEIKQNLDSSIIIYQHMYINSIQEINLSKERIKEHESSLTSAENTLCRSTVGQLNWIRIIKTRHYLFSMWIQHKISDSNNIRYSLLQQNYLKCEKLKKQHQIP